MADNLADVFRCVEFCAACDRIFQSAKFRFMEFLRLFAGNTGEETVMAVRFGKRAEEIASRRRMTMDDMFFFKEGKRSIHRHKVYGVSCTRNAFVNISRSKRFGSLLQYLRDETPGGSAAE